ncbi:unnamed protein product [Polarella glacialis]|uniref:Folate/biopterin transporter n=1 Tax=Polarella glacialis TaxID=89957 RepID=A0A813DH64_POLGL|nr:unnamed protein product [Polarella glacialis]CAE8660846.1 unnamed protein product [Polarella glacialis]
MTTKSDLSPEGPAVIGRFYIGSSSNIGASGEPDGAANEAMCGGSGGSDDEESALLTGVKRACPALNGEGSSLLGTFEELQHHFGYKLLTILFVSQHLMKGFALSFISPCTQYLLASYKVSGPHMQVYGSVMMLPWAMKPIIGLLSDAVPIAGYNKAPYMAIVTILGMFAFACIGVLPQQHLSIMGLVVCLFLINLQFSTCDLLAEAKYAEQMQAKPEHGPALMSFVWSGMTAAGLIATIMIGPIMLHLGPKAPFILAIIPASVILVPLARGFMEEKKKTAEDLSEVWVMLGRQKEACMLCILMFTGTIVLTVEGILFDSVRLNAVAAILMALVMLAAFSIVLRPEIARVNAFFLIQSSVGFSISGASFYFYTDSPKAFPDGPHFNMEFYTSVLGICGSVCSLLGIYLYQRYATSWGYRRLLLVSNLALSILSLSDVVLFTRLNKRMGLPDHAFVLGASVLASVVNQWQWMPGVVIMSQLCPKGMEAIMYALLAGCHNLGNIIASNSGALVLELLGVNPSGADNETEQFKYLWVGSALSTILPLFTLVLIPWLIPDVTQTDKILKDNPDDATANSLWRPRSTDVKTIVVLWASH